MRDAVKLIAQIAGLASVYLLIVVVLASQDFRSHRFNDSDGRWYPFDAQ